MKSKKSNKEPQPQPTEPTDAGHRVVDEENLLRSDDDLRAEREGLNSPAPLHHAKPNDGDGEIAEEKKVESDEPVPYQHVPLMMQGNTHVPTTGSAALVDEIGGLPSLLRMTRSFYDKAFQDATLDRFIRSHSDPHGDRFSKWIHTKLTGATSGTRTAGRDSTSRSTTGAPRTWRRGTARSVPRPSGDGTSSSTSAAFG